MHLRQAKKHTSRELYREILENSFKSRDSEKLRGFSYGQTDGRNEFKVQ